MTSEASPTDDALRKRLGSWLGEHLPGAAEVEVGAVARHGSGYSAETLVVPARIEGARGPRDERFVLRLEVAEPAIYPAQNPALDVEVEIQYRAMEALGRASAVPLAPLIGLERDAAVLGQPFFVMGFVDGEVPVVDPPYTREGFFAEASADDRRRLVEGGLRALAGVHAVDVRRAGLDWLAPPGIAPGTRMQLDLWQTFAERELQGREHPLLERAFAWLREREPEDASLVLSWGDARPGNIIFRDFDPVCLTDFENVAIGPPELDLGWWLMFDRTCHEVLDIPRLPGEPSRTAQREFYAEVSGRALGDVHYYEVLAAVRYAAIVVRVMNRSVERGLLPKDHTVWRDNPPVTALAALLEGPT